MWDKNDAAASRTSTRPWRIRRLRRHTIALTRTSGQTTTTNTNDDTQQKHKPNSKAHSHNNNTAGDE